MKTEDTNFIKTVKEASAIHSEISEHVGYLGYDMNPIGGREDMFPAMKKEALKEISEIRVLLNTLENLLEPSVSPPPPVKLKQIEEWGEILDKWKEYCLDTRQTWNSVVEFTNWLKQYFPVQRKEKEVTLPSIDEAGVIALNVASNVRPKLTENNEAYFIAGFQECVKYLMSQQQISVQSKAEVPSEKSDTCFSCTDPKGCYKNQGCLHP